MITVQPDSRLLDLSHRLFRQCKGWPELYVFRSGYHLKGDEWLPIVLSEPTLRLNEAFKKRWEIETFFAAFKSRGFNLEDAGREAENVFFRPLALLAVVFTLVIVVARLRASVEDGNLETSPPAKFGLLICIQHVVSDGNQLWTLGPHGPA
jgi:hypothetical protein